MPGSRNTSVPLRITDIRQVAMGNGAGAAAALPTLQGHVAQLRAVCPGQKIYIGRAADVATVTTTSKTYPLADGEAITVEIGNSNNLCAFADAVGCFLAIITGTWV